MSAGDIDSNYGVVSLAAEGRVTATKVHTDGSILVAATPGVVGVERISSISKYKVDGTLDESFSNKGIFSLAANQRVQGIEEVTGGILLLVSNDDGTKNEIVKLKSDGSIDGSFQKILTSSFSVPSGNTFSVTSDNTIIALTGGESISTYNANGSLKSVAKGVLKDDRGPGGSEVITATVTPNGKVIAEFRAPIGDIPLKGIRKFNSDGSLATNFSAEYVGISSQIIAANDGSFYEYPDDRYLLIKHLANGQVDRSFGVNGSLDLLSVFGNSLPQSFKPFFTPDGKILVKGLTPTAGGSSLSLVRYNANGTLDKTFGDDGIRILQGGSSSGVLDATVATQKDGDIVSVDGGVLARYKSDGSTPINENRVGTNNADGIAGGSGNDVIFGRGGDDRLFGASGNDSIDGENGNDYINGGKGNDFLYGANGSDTLFGENGNDYLNGGYDNDVLVGGNDADTLFGDLGDDSIYGGDDNDQIFGGDGSDYLNGGYGADTIRGDDGADIIVSDKGNDFLYGDNGNDTIYGGDNDGAISSNRDPIDYVGAGNNYSNGGNGDDLLVGNGGNDTIVGDDGNDRIFGSRGNDFLYGGNGNDSIYGGNNIGVFNGNSVDADYIDGGYGDDYLIGSEGNGTLFGDVGNDYLNGYDGNDKLFGGEGNDILEDSNGTNLLNGGNGNDILFSGGYNTLTGGTGQDTFGGFYGGTAIITDFQAGTDKISINKVVFSALQSLKGDGFSIANEFAVVNNSSTVDSSQALIVYNTQTGNLTYNLDREVVGIGNRDEFAKLQGTSNLTASDFVIV